MIKRNLFFPTPVWTIKLDNYKDINEKMYEFIKSNQKKDNIGVKKSNVNGWHSKHFDISEKEPKQFISFIKPIIEQVITDMDWNKEKQITKITNMWAIINTDGSLNLRHQHKNTTITGAYYVRAPENSGDIVFYDPRPAPVYFHPIVSTPNSLNTQINSLTPTEGSLFLFPGYLQHSVNENLSKNERIVISFNITIN
tara:strand:+ start:789 stop:1379 length:591 start_codon:yes stop_codon:yes gene_type:complete